MSSSTINERFILAEDGALKAKFSGLEVTYPKKHPVDVWYRWPNAELREVKRPYIALNLVNIMKADHREHAGANHVLGYEPYGFDSGEVDPETGYAVAEHWPTPYDLTYTVTTVTADPRHDRELMIKMLGDRHLLPWRLAYLEIPEDHTLRRVDVLDVTENARRDTNNDIEYRRVWTINVESELFVGDVNAVHAALEVGWFLQSVDDDELREEFHVTE